MYAMTKEDKLLLETYKAIGTPAWIIDQLEHPFPKPESGYAPLPHEVTATFNRMLHEFPPKPDSGLLEDDE